MLGNELVKNELIANKEFEKLNNFNQMQEYLIKKNEVPFKAKNIIRESQ